MTSGVEELPSLEVNSTPISKERGILLKQHGLFPNPPQTTQISKSTKCAEYFLAAGIGNKPQVLNVNSVTVQDTIDEDEPLVTQIFLHAL